MIKIGLFILVWQLTSSFMAFPAYCETTSTNPVHPAILHNYNPAFGDYYIQSLEMKDNKWNKFPITINIKQVPARYKSTVISAINEWGVYLPLKIYHSENNNDISIAWIYKMPKERTEKHIFQPVLSSFFA
jgi:hypothetical protein